MYQSVTLFVNFMGRLKHELTVQWFKDGIALEDHDARIFTSFVTRPNKGMNTMLSLPSVGTSDAGIYRVVISSQISVKSGAPAISSNQEVSFHINVTTALCKSKIILIILAMLPTLLFMLAVPITCSYPSIINGTIESNRTVFLVGDNAMVQCSRGSHFIIICIENGTWTPPPESYCEARSRESLKLSSLFVLFISHTLFIIIY